MPHEILASHNRFVLPATLSLAMLLTACNEHNKPHTSVPTPTTTAVAKCAEFAVSLSEGQGAKIIDPKQDASYFVTNIGASESTILGVQLKHLTAINEDIRYTYDYTPQDFVYQDGSSAHLEVRPTATSVGSSVLNIVGRTCI